MRQAGTIATKQDADRFANYLLSLGISSKVDGANDQWAIWVHDENQLARSKDELAQFHEQPSDARYLAAEQAAKIARRETAEKLRQARKNYVDMRNEWASPWRRRPVTLAMIAVCAALALGLFEEFHADLMYSWPDILAGQVWRLVTPVFLHAPLAVNPLHLIFNMWWLYDLGSLIERRLGSIRFAMLALVIALVSNYAQFYMRGPNFVGMSGVVFGLLGYAWVRGRLDPTCGLHVRPDVAFWMIGWMVLCGVGAVGNVANWAHGGGLAAGAALGYLPHLGKRLRER